MKKYIVLSVNDNHDYLYFTPLTCWAWRKFGWEPLVFFQSKFGKYYHEVAPHPLDNLVWKTAKAYKVILDTIPGYRSDTVTQISRLYGSCVIEDGYLMTGDIDMLPLSDYWQPNLSSVTVYGHDLTGFGHFPICYIGAHSAKWDDLMGLQSVEDFNAAISHDLNKLPQAKDPDFYKYWFSDQDLITQRLKEYGTGKIDFINRGQYANGYAKGRVDRGAWTLDHEQFIDSHLFQQTWQNDEKVRKTFELLERVWPNEDFQWFRDYTAKFRELAR